MSAWRALCPTLPGWRTSLNSTPSRAAVCAFMKVRLWRRRSPVSVSSGIGRASRNTVWRRSRSSDPEEARIMQRYGMVIGIRPEMMGEYKRLHAAVWPTVLAQISRSHIRNYTIYFREPENLLFSYFEYHGED